MNGQLELFRETVAAIVPGNPYWHKPDREVVLEVGELYCLTYGAAIGSSPRTIVWRHVRFESRAGDELRFRDPAGRLRRMELARLGGAAGSIRPEASQPARRRVDSAL